LIPPDLPSQVNVESLIRLVGSDLNMIVPIVSFNELSCSDWKHLPELVASGLNGRADVVFCTHLDQVSQGNTDQVETLAKAFWPRGALDTNRIIPFSSVMGLSVRDLLDRSQVAKPPFRAIWNQDSVGYHVRGLLFSIA